MSENTEGTMESWINELVELREKVGLKSDREYLRTLGVHAIKAQIKHLKVIVYTTYGY